MSIAAAQAAKFYADVAANGKAWTLMEPGHQSDLLHFKMASGTEVVPMWSSLSRIEKQIKDIESFNTFIPLEIDWQHFKDEGLAQFKKDNLSIGLNWSGAGATGYDRDAQGVVDSVEAYRSRIKK